MGWVLMSERDLKRIEVLTQVDDGDLGVTAAAHLMNMSRRHVYRLLDRFRSEGPGGIRHRARGRVLAWMKEQQEANLPPPKVKSASEKGGYKRRGRRPGLRTDFVNDLEVNAKRRKALQSMDAAE